MKNSVIMAVVALLLTFCTTSRPKTEDVETVKEVNLEKYMGTWYEIARYQHRFENNLVGVTATYTLRSNGTIHIRNSGIEGDFDGEQVTVEAKAKVPDKNEPGKLKVAYFLWYNSDYYILDVDRRNYSYALVGGRDKEYLWILSRTPKLGDRVTRNLVQKAHDLGYDTTRLYWVPQLTIEK